MMWQKIEVALRDPEILSGEQLILVCDNRIQGGFPQVVYYDNDVPTTKLGRWIWAVVDCDTRYHEDAFTHWMHIPSPPKESL